MNEATGRSCSPIFPTTQWSEVVRAADCEPARAAAALEKLCSRYWYPVYASVRQWGYSVHDAEDLTQGFFAGLLAREGFRRLDRSRGRARTFILAALGNYLHNEYQRAHALKRGGGRLAISLDEQLAEQLYQQEAVQHDPVERVFDRRWAAVLVRRVIDELRREYEQRGHGGLFAGLQAWLTGQPDPGAYARLAAQHGLVPGSVMVVLHRARRRFGELLRREVAHTVSDPDDVEGELRHLIAAIAAE